MIMCPRKVNIPLFVFRIFTIVLTEPDTPMLWWIPNSTTASTQHTSNELPRIGAISLIGMDRSTSSTNTHLSKPELKVTYFYTAKVQISFLDYLCTC